MNASRQLPARANLEHLRNEAKQRLREMRTRDAALKLADAQLLIAREYGFASWRQLKAAVDDRDRDRVFTAARDGDLSTVRRALDGGFHPGTTDKTGRTIHQVAKALGHTHVELLMRECQERDERPDEVKQAVKAIQAAAADGRGDEHHVNVLGWATCLGRVREDVAGYLLSVGAKLNIWSAIALDRGDDVRRFVQDDPSALAARMSRNEHYRTPLHHAAAVNRPDMVRVLIERGVDVNAKRVLWDCNHTALHITVEHGVIELTRLLLDAGADPNIRDDKYHATALGWAEYCEQPQIADLLRQRGATE